jgi:predicted small lipoprotein YifL
MKPIAIVLAGAEECASGRCNFQCPAQLVKALARRQAGGLTVYSATIQASRDFIMKRFLLPFIGLVVLSAALAGCGQKGPLYLPGDEETAKERDKDRFEL